MSGEQPSYCENCGQRVINLADPWSLYPQWVHYRSRTRQCGMPDVAIPVAGDREGGAT